MIDHDAVVHSLALHLADDTEWDQPPRLFWLMADTELVAADRFTTALDAVMNGGGRLPAVLAAVADRLLADCLADPAEAGIPAGCIGVVVRTESWVVPIPTDTPPAHAAETERDPRTREVLTRSGGRLADHPDAVDRADLYTVTTDDHLHWLSWDRGGMAPEVQHLDLTTTPPPGRVPRLVRRLARIVRRYA